MNGRSIGWGVRVSLAAALALSVCASSAATEGTAQASKQFDRATKAAARGDYAEAADAFEQAYRLAPHGATLFNAALAWEAAGDRARAADAYAGALDRGGLADSQEKDARKRLRALESRLGRLDITGPAGTLVSVAHAERVPVPVRVHVDRGQHEVRFWPPGGKGQVRLVTAGAEPVELRFEPAGDTARKEPEPRKPEQEHQLPQRPSASVAAWTAIGAGVALAGATTYLGLEALSARNEFYDSGRTDAHAHDRAESLRTWTNVTLVGAVAATGLGVYLLVRTPEAATSPSSARASLQLGLGGMTVSGQF